VMEILKHNAQEFGGIQGSLMSAQEVAQRMCCAAYCGHFGFAQVLMSSWGTLKRPVGAETFELQPSYTYRVICRRHFVIMALVQAHSLGDPLPLQAGKEAADAVGIDWSEIFAARTTPQPVRPGEFLCLDCGGIMMSETAGMPVGKRWVHNCV
jgi:hypothetical protein